MDGKILWFYLKQEKNYTKFIQILIKNLYLLENDVPSLY